jgi:hypothetical protein
VTNHINHSHHGIDPRPSLSALRKEKPSVPFFLIVIPGVVAIVAAFFVPHSFVRLGLLAFGSAVILFAMLVVTYKFMQTRKTSYATQALISLVNNDASPCFLPASSLIWRVGFHFAMKRQQIGSANGRSKRLVVRFKNCLPTPERCFSDCKVRRKRWAARANIL